MKDYFLKELTAFGLSEKEAKLYVTLLELEVATVFEASKQSGINRSSAYVVLEGLRKKGLAGISDDKKVRRYIAASPEILLHVAKNAAQEREAIKTGIESVVPELKALHKDTAQRPIVRVFQGKNGLINGFEDTLSCKEKVMRVVSSIEKIYELLPEYVPNYVRRRVEKGIKMYGIHPLNSFVQEFIKMDVKTFDEPVVIPKEKYKNPADLAIYDNKIGYMSAEDGGYAVIIESKAMADVMRSVFDLAYEEAKRLNVVPELSKNLGPKNS